MYDGGAAFPHGEEPKQWNAELGLSIRDYFAAKAMQALITEGGLLDDSEALLRRDIAVTAKRAYEIADAMLVQRAKE